jgi:hypothetical protein
MLQSNRLIDILVTLLMGCLGLLGWIQLNEKHSFNTETIVTMESKLPNLVEERLCSNNNYEIYL